jgi:hypothetical protein
MIQIVVFEHFIGLLIVFICLFESLQLLQAISNIDPIDTKKMLVVLRIKLFLYLQGITVILVCLLVVSN